MNRKPFYRKVAYCTAIAVLLLPLSWLGQPPAGVEGRGGKLASLRAEYDLSQAQLGEIDPASETMRLATLGMNGVAANILWHKAIHYHKVKDWSNFMASVNQIIKLQPNFIKVWEFQAHNVSYNTSVEFDDYKHRYAWVKRGIEFLIDGTRYNEDEPRLLSYTGHFFGQKLGRADEAKQFRRIFATDRDFHDDFRHLVDIDNAIGQSGFPDNWLVSRLWYLRGQNVVDNRPDRPLRGESPLIFHSHPAKSRINYAIFNEKDGYHGERARIDWARALREWSDEYGSRQIPSSFGHTLRLNERESILADADRLRTELVKLAGISFEEIKNEKRAKLSPEMLQALDTPPEQRTPEQYPLAFEAGAKIYVPTSDVVERAPKDKQNEAKRMASLIDDMALLADRIDRYRNIVNYDYWKTRCEVEMTELADQARQLVFEADQKREKAILTGSDGAKELYEQAWQAWAELFQKHPALKDDLMAEELVPSIKRYEDVLNQLDQKLPDDFVLADVLERYDDRYRQLRELRLRQEANKQKLIEQTGELVKPKPKSGEATQPNETEPPAAQPPRPADDADAKTPEEPKPAASESPQPTPPTLDGASPPKENGAEPAAENTPETGSDAAGEKPEE
jgi:hypothetical protein